MHPPRPRYNAIGRIAGDGALRVPRDA